MKISIWRQFSSNHSSRFTVVGEFQTTEAATQAVAELKALAEAISKWYEDNPDDLEERMSGELVDPTPPEIEFGQRYQIDWNEYSVDWWTDQLPVTQYERLVFVNGTESDVGAKPFDQLLQKIGGTPAVDGVLVDNGDEAYFNVVVNVSCQAPNPETTEGIVAATSIYFEADRKFRQSRDLSQFDMFATPWRDYTLGGLTGFSSTSGAVSRTGLSLRFEKLSFFHLGYGLPGLLAYLKAQGCTQVEYQLIEKEWGEEE